ncbi:MAG: tetratricopeptide repeat protein [bacterium]|nr:tetratricopeptide repeat protein [bacterium]
MMKKIFDKAVKIGMAASEKSMKTEKLDMVDICDRVSKIGLYALVFLLPLAFLPWTANVLEFNKQALLIILAFVSFFAWMLKVLILGKAKVNLSLVYVPIVLMIAVYLLSTLFSYWKYGSFWGWPQVTSESLASVVALSLVYILIVNIFNRKEILYLASTLVLSGMTAMIFGILQLFGIFVLPIGFTKAVSFNTIGGITNFGIFVSVLLPLSMMLLITSDRNLFRIIFGGAILLEAVALLVVNIPVVWWTALIGSALVFAFAMQRRDLFDGRWLVMPMFFLALALLFSFFNFGIPGMPEKPVEIFLKHKPSIELTLKSIQISPVFGTGPGTFSSVFAKYKDASLNDTAFWNVGFDWSSSKFLTVLATVGILGGLAFIVLIGFFIYFGIIFLFRKSHIDDISSKSEEALDKNFFWNLGIGLFISFIVLSISYFLYSSNLTLDFVYFVIMALFVGLLYPVKKEFALKSSSLLTLAFTFSVTIVFVFGLGIIISEGQRYVSAVSYLGGVKNWQEGNFDSAIKKMDRAAIISPAVDLYWRESAQAYLQKISIVAGNPELSQDQKAKEIQLSINKAVNAAKAATDSNPKSFSNWALRGQIYKGLIGTVQGTRQWAVDAYKEAMNLDPLNPSYYVQTGECVLEEVARLSEEDKDKKGLLLEEAKEYFEKAIELKGDYALAHFQIARIYMDQDRQNEAIDSLEKAKASAPDDTGLAFQLGLIYYQNKKYDKAMGEFERAVWYNPNYSNALYFLGLTYDFLERKNDAKIVFEKILELNPGHGLAISILNNLKAGKNALAGIENGSEPIEEQPETQEDQ